MTKAQREAAITVIEEAEYIGTREYFTYERRWQSLADEGLVSQEFIDQEPPRVDEVKGPCCVIGHLAWAINAVEADLINKAVGEHYGLTGHIADLISINDQAQDHNRKARLLNFLLNLPTED